MFSAFFVLVSILVCMNANAYNFSGIAVGAGTCILGPSSAVEFEIVHTATRFVVKKCHYGGYFSGSVDFYCSAMHYELAIRNGSELWQVDSVPPRQVGTISNDEVSVQATYPKYETTYVIKHDGDHLYFLLETIQNGSVFERSEARLTKIP